MTVGATPFAASYFHGSKADLTLGDTIQAGFPSNFGSGRPAAFAYVAATLDAAVWGAELALGGGRPRIYVVEPTGHVEDDPNLTDKKFPGNPTRSFRTRHPVRIIGEVVGWTGHAPDRLSTMRNGVEEARRLGVEAIED